ncbi:uncharacterized protein N7483_002274 [Penicillium malachiteum]|uniref:uncharacterized protein n=1 Tax=Penicillium malachiteum TaxID=1324776 RepID=UPI0025482F9D|nr:uncharacterized protein N7483_002274 [Penicillium malachiteum]KAJ5737149.1 hypothetical protein N7483_002274 [Penicillium malachiteum]
MSRPKHRRKAAFAVLGETLTLAIINYGTGKIVKVANGRAVTIPVTSDSHESYWVVNASVADQTLNAILNGSSAEAIPSSGGNPIPISQWQITPNEDNSEVFYITDPQSGTRLEGAGPRTEISAISTDALTSGPKHDDIHLWQLVAIVAANNLTPASNGASFLSQWEDKKIVYTPKKPVATVASIDKNDIKTLKDKGNKIKESDEDALLNGGVRIDRQGFFQKKPGKDSTYFANLQGQVSKLSVWQVNIQTGQEFGVAAIRKEMAESMNSDPPKELWLEA